MTRVDDTRIRAVQPLISAAALRQELPLSDTAMQFVARTRVAIEDVIAGRDKRFVVVVGPCSIHERDAALEYAARLAVLARRYEDELIVVMRAYFEKPRTIVGWKGLINDPALDESYQINRGLRLARRILLAINERGVATGSEVLDTHVPQYIGDLSSWVAIGARTVASQIHREIASGLSMPVGFKNSIDGGTDLAVDAVVAARHQHWFPSITVDGQPAVFRTTGNEACHIVLRGGHQSGPNCDIASIRRVCALLADKSLPPRVMVDCSHGNSDKDYRRQAIVAASLCDQMASGARESILGAMLESYLVEGRQDYVNGRTAVYGQSITDSCISFSETEQILAQFARTINHRAASVHCAHSVNAGV